MGTLDVSLEVLCGQSDTTNPITYHFFNTKSEVLLPCFPFLSSRAIPALLLYPHPHCLSSPLPPPPRESVYEAIWLVSESHRLTALTLATSSSLCAQKKRSFMCFFLFKFMKAAKSQNFFRKLGATR